MSAITDESQVRRVSMSLEDYLALPEGVRAEFVDGVALMMAPAGSHHNRVARRIANAIEVACPRLYVATDSGLVTHPTRRRVPDVLAVAADEDFHYTEQIPVIAVEVLSPSTRGEDTVRKSHEYAARGAQQYWIVDRDLAALTVYANTGDGWDVLLELDATRPTGGVEIPGGGRVELDLGALLAP